MLIFVLGTVSEMKSIIDIETPSGKLFRIPEMLWCSLRRWRQKCRKQIQEKELLTDLFWQFFLSCHSSGYSPYSNYHHCKQIINVGFISANLIHSYQDWFI